MIDRSFTRAKNRSEHSRVGRAWRVAGSYSSGEALEVKIKLYIRRKEIDQTMETFASKVRCESGSRFNPMLEEDRGWLARGKLGHDIEAMEGVIEAMAKGSNQTMEKELNPFKEKHGEILPKDIERNFSGFLIRKIVVPFKIDSVKLIARIALLKDMDPNSKVYGA